MSSVLLGLQSEAEVIQGYNEMKTLEAAGQGKKWKALSCNPW